MLHGVVHQTVLGDQRQAGELGSAHVRRQVIAAAEIDHAHLAAGEGGLQQALHLVSKHHAGKSSARPGFTSDPQVGAYTS